MITKFKSGDFSVEIFRGVEGVTVLLKKGIEIIGRCFCTLKDDVATIQTLIVSEEYRNQRLILPFLYDYLRQAGINEVEFEGVTQLWKQDTEYNSVVYAVGYFLFRKGNFIPISVLKDVIKEDSTSEVIKREIKKLGIKVKEGREDWIGKLKFPALVKSNRSEYAVVLSYNDKDFPDEVEVFHPETGEILRWTANAFEEGWSKWYLI